MMKLKVTQTKSIIDQSERLKKTMRALGLRKLHQSVVHAASPQIVGMIEKVRHLVDVEEVND